MNVASGSRERLAKCGIDPHGSAGDETLDRQEIELDLGRRSALRQLITARRMALRAVMAICGYGFECVQPILRSSDDRKSRLLNYSIGRLCRVRSPKAGMEVLVGRYAVRVDLTRMIGSGCPPPPNSGRDRSKMSRTGWASLCSPGRS